MRIGWVLFLLLSFYSASASDNEVDTLIVGYTEAPPFIIQDAEELDGISIWLWEKVARDLDRPYRYQRMSFGSMLDALEDGSIDLSINPLTMTSDRSRKYSFTSPFYVSNSTVLVHSSPSIQKAIVILKTFFSVNFLRVLALLLIVISIFGTLAWLFERKANPQHFRPGLKGLWDGFWWSTVTMTTVGYGDKSPKSRGGKVIALIWMFTALIFISGLTATLASTLLRTELNETNLTLGDFKNERVGTLASTSTETFLRQRFFKDIELYSDLNDAFDDLEQHRLDAFMYDEPILKYRLSNKPGDTSIELLPIRFDLQLYAFALSNKRNDLVQAASQSILEYSESMDWKMLLSEYGLSEF